MTRLCLLPALLPFPITLVLLAWLALHQPARPGLLAYTVEMTDERFMVYLLRPQTGRFSEVSEGDWAGWASDGLLCVRPAHLHLRPFIVYDPAKDSRRVVETCEAATRTGHEPVQVMLPLGGSVGRWKTPPPVLIDLATGVHLRAPVPRFTFAVRQVSWALP